MYKPRIVPRRLLVLTALLTSLLHLGTVTALPSMNEMEATRVDHEPIDEQTANTPIPIHVNTAELRGRVNVRLGYRKAGADWKRVDMKKGPAASYQEQIPCEVVRGAEEVQYYIEIRDQQGQVVKRLGSEDVPQIVLMVDSAKSPPHFPDQAPPKTCSEASSAGAAPADDSPEAWAAFNRGDDPDAEKPKARKKFPLYFSLAVMQDAQLAGGFDVCDPDSPDAAGFSCYRQNGTPYTGSSQTQFGGEGGGYKIATTRVLLGADWPLLDPLSVGARLGYVVRGGGPATAGGKAFMPLHAEARAAYWFGDKAYGTSGFSPFALLAFGLAQVDSMNQSAVNRDPSASDMEPQRQKLDIWKKSGQTFASAGVGSYFEIGKKNGLLLELRVAYLFPATGIATSASLGYAMGFDL